MGWGGQFKPMLSLPFQPAYFRKSPQCFVCRESKLPQVTKLSKTIHLDNQAAHGVGSLRAPPLLTLTLTSLKANDTLLARLPREITPLVPAAACLPRQAPGCPLLPAACHPSGRQVTSTVHVHAELGPAPTSPDPCPQLHSVTSLGPLFKQIPYNKKSLFFLLLWAEGSTTGILYSLNLSEANTVQDPSIIFYSLPPSHRTVIPQLSPPPTPNSV